MTLIKADSFIINADRFITTDIINETSQIKFITTDLINLCEINNLINISVAFNY